jgi:hypothetical protein
MKQKKRHKNASCIWPQNPAKAGACNAWVVGAVAASTADGTGAGTANVGIGIIQRKCGVAPHRGWHLVVAIIVLALSCCCTAPTNRRVAYIGTRATAPVTGSRAPVFPAPDQPAAFSAQARVPMTGSQPSPGEPLGELAAPSIGKIAYATTETGPGLRGWQHQPGLYEGLHKSASGGVTPLLMYSGNDGDIASSLFDKYCDWACGLHPQVFGCLVRVTLVLGLSTLCCWWAFR